MRRTLAKFGLPFEKATPLVHFPKPLNVRGITRVLLVVIIIIIMIIIMIIIIIIIIIIIYYFYYYYYHLLDITLGETVQGNFNKATSKSFF